MWMSYVRAAIRKNSVGNVRGCKGKGTTRIVFFFFFQAEDGIRDLVRSVGSEKCIRDRSMPVPALPSIERQLELLVQRRVLMLSLIHI